jgi:4-amino-4-deoxy-L-arabinose transferase-like glycosyltransferase
LSRAFLIIPLLILYFSYLGGVGFVGPDEPRYASIGREMAQSGDWITPRLDGAAWFEKPPLLYWTTATGHLLRLPDEYAARLPLALASFAFLMFFGAVLEREFSARVAISAMAILSTSAGWLAYSFVAVPDLLMSAALGAAMFIALFDTRRSQGYLAGVLLGVAMLAKGFVPLVLFAPVFLIARGKRLAIVAGCVIAAAPWFALCGARNGMPFWREFWWKHHVLRFFTPSLEHVQPFWYFVPILLAGLFPWTPLAALLVRRKIYDDVRVRFLALWLVYALLFFTISKNKLPGYILPVFPAMAVLLAVAIDKGIVSRGAKAGWLVASALMLMLLPSVMRALPDALLSGLRRAPLASAPAEPYLVVAAGVAWLAWKEKHVLAVLTVAGAAAAGVLYLKVRTFPALDQHVSVRMFWRTHGPAAAGACVDRSVRRDWDYGLNYYAGRPLSDCEGDAPPRITVENGRLVLQRYVAPIASPLARFPLP